MKQNNFLMILLTLGILFLIPYTLSGQSHRDPPFIQVVSAEKPLIIDGILNETDWARRFDYLVFGANALPGDVSYTVTGGILVDPGYTDTTTTLVKFLRYGLNLYISLQSNDESDCRRTIGWEGDGLFMKIKKADGTPVEYKLFYNLDGTGAPIRFETPGNDPTLGQGAGRVNPGTIVNQLTPPDSGYTAEMVIYLDKLGYTDPYAEIPVLINIFDPDGFDDVTTTGSYHKMWWGSEWGPEFRILRLSDPPLKIAHKTDATMTLDGKLDEAFWVNADSIVVGKGSGSSTGGYYMQWNHPTNTYNDQSMATVKFMHNGTDLYIGVQSNDKSVCKWSPGWEADGLFLWMTNKDEYLPAPHLRMEIKNMYFDATIGAGSVFEVNPNVPTGAADGKSFEPVGTVTHTELGGPDAGYSLEVLIKTDLFGYAIGDTVRLGVVIWDLDYADAVAFSADSSDYAPNWWGTQWADRTFEKYYLFRNVHLSGRPSDVEDNSQPFNFNLSQNYPNPFNPTTSIKYSIPEDGFVTLTIYDVLGKAVATLVNENKKVGNYYATWDASKSSSGVYFYQLKTNKHILTRKMMLVR
jgi:hypothetical protein